MREIPHSIATIESQHGLNEGNVGEVVKGVVVVLGNAIDYFLAGVHRLYIDACFSSDGWNILVACFLDANHRIQPVGFRLGQSDTHFVFFWFLSIITILQLFIHIVDIVTPSTSQQYHSCCHRSTFVITCRSAAYPIMDTEAHFATTSITQQA